MEANFEAGQAFGVSEVGLNIESGDNYSGGVGDLLGDHLPLVLIVDLLSIVLLVFLLGHHLPLVLLHRLQVARCTQYQQSLTDKTRPNLWL